ncbi:hypothetical protein LIER_11292 [Lithospermum erythrorhizon]|uniref:RNase H type-1 domain-containing protein n=1 Tax=Lithospermum erythrorhizon TaxID=34254 RepID=A0AAV3PMT8_LITER
MLVKGDSKLVIDQIQGKFGIKSEVLKIYHSKTMSLAQGFARISFMHIPREANEEADWLSRLAITYYSELPEGVITPEVGFPTYRQARFDEERNDQRLLEALKFTDKLIDEALYKILKYKQLLARTYNRRILGPGTYELEDLDDKSIVRTWHASKLCNPNMGLKPSLLRDRSINKMTFSLFIALCIIMRRHYNK